MPDAARPPGSRGTAITRRPPFSENPVVGARGLQTRQRILDAALRVFGERGYESATLERVAAIAGCSRAAVYQYFDDKGHIYRELADQAARQLWTSVEGLDPLTADQQGWDTLRGWVSRHSAIHARYQPLYRTFAAAAGSDATLAGGSARFHAELVALFQSKLPPAGVSPRGQEAMLGLLLGALGQALDLAAALRTALPDEYTAARLDIALTDVLHRALFGFVAGVNDRVRGHRRTRRLDMGADMAALFRRLQALESEAEHPGRRTLGALLAVAEEVIVERGYLGTRVDDVVDAAGVSRGAFYRYFADKHELVRLVTARALLELSSTFAQFPDLLPGDPTWPGALRDWLERFVAVSRRHGATVGVWLDANRTDEVLGAGAAPAVDWGRRRLARVLARRDFGDADAEAVVLLGVVEAFASRPRAPTEVDAVVSLLEPALLGGDEARRDR